MKYIYTIFTSIRCLLFGDVYVKSTVNAATCNARVAVGASVF